MSEGNMPPNNGPNAQPNQGGQGDRPDLNKNTGNQDGGQQGYNQQQNYNQDQNYNQQQNNNQQQNYNQNYGNTDPYASGYQQNLPGATAALVCGILSIVFAGLIGLILAIVAVTKAGTAIKTFEYNPQMYSRSSYNNAKAGRVCAIIGICMIPLAIIIVIAANS